MPYLNRLYDAYAEGWRMWAVIQEPPEKAREYAMRYGARYPFLIDAPGYEVSRLYDIPATPAIFIVDGSGATLYATHGFAKGDLNEISDKLAGITGSPAVVVAPPGDGQRDFRPGCLPRHLMPTRPLR
jgi:hypothetical protein